MVRIEEAVERYRRFVLSLPSFERDKPYLVFGGRMLSPMYSVRWRRGPPWESSWRRPRLRWLEDEGPAAGEVQDVA